jgi:hypothetical protein
VDKVRGLLIGSVVDGFFMLIIDTVIEEFLTKFGTFVSYSPFREVRSEKETALLFTVTWLTLLSATIEAGRKTLNIPDEGMASIITKLMLYDEKEPMIGLLAVVLIAVIALGYTSIEREPVDLRKPF